MLGPPAGELLTTKSSPPLAEAPLLGPGPPPPAAAALLDSWVTTRGAVAGGGAVAAAGANIEPMLRVPPLIPSLADMSAACSVSDLDMLVSNSTPFIPGST